MSSGDNFRGSQITLDGKLADNTTTAIFTAVGATWIHSITATENNSGTPTLTIEKYNGTTSYYLRKAVAMTAGTQVIYNEPFLLPLGWSIRMTSNDASGHVDWSVTYDAPPAGKLR